MVQALSWDEMLRMFRMLGGTAENIVVKQGPLGRGLMAKDPERPVLVRVPKNLLFPVQDVDFEGDLLRIKKTADIGDAERLFFDCYENGFSWGAGGRLESIAFIAALDALPSEVRTLLAEEFGFEDLLQGEAVERAQKRFLRSRLLRWDDADVIMPLIELANHDPAGIPYGKEGDLSIQGTVKDEVLVSYGAHDTLSIFQTFGFVSREPGAFSLPTKVQLEDRELFVFWDTSAPVQRGKAWVPRLTMYNRMPALSFLLIGHRAMPRQPRSIFRILAGEAGVKKPDETFDSILQFNWAKFLKLLAALEPHEGDMVVTLRKMARLQLEAMSHCIGSIELETPESAKPAKEEVWSLSIS